MFRKVQLFCGKGEKVSVYFGGLAGSIAIQRPQKIIFESGDPKKSFKVPRRTEGQYRSFRGKGLRIPKWWGLVVYRRLAVSETQEMLTEFGVTQWVPGEMLWTWEISAFLWHWMCLGSLERAMPNIKSPTCPNRGHREKVQCRFAWNLGSVLNFRKPGFLSVSSWGPGNFLIFRMLWGGENIQNIWLLGHSKELGKTRYRLCARVCFVLDLTRGTWEMCDLGGPAWPMVTAAHSLDKCCVCLGGLGNSV